MKKRRFLPVGQEDFKEIIENNGYYVDKTLLIKKLLDVRGKVTLFTRPRRFGKTLGISMLQYFFENTGINQRALFENLAILKEEDICEKYMGQYPVIRLSLKSAKQESFSYAFAAMKQTIAEEFRRHEKEVKAYEFEKDRIQRILNAQGEGQDYLTSLQFLSQILYHQYGKRVIVLLDEYDVPLENAYFHGYYDKMVNFIRSLFESVLKTNSCLEFAVITGCLRISKESIFTGLNNLRIISIMDKAYEEYFGFTQEETKQILDYYGLKSHMSDIREWYDGYLFGEQEIYNPWSVLSYISDLLENEHAKPKPYWSNTSSNDIIRHLIEGADLQTRSKVESLIAGDTIESVVHEDITYADIEESEENLWNFLYFTGYLKKVSERSVGDQRFIRMQVPNVEINYIYKSKVSEWMKEKIQQEDLSQLYDALLSGNEVDLQDQLGRQLRESISFYDYKEAFYHGFLLGLLKPLDEYLIESNREAGDGRLDILLRSLDVRKPVVIVELKQSGVFQDMETKATEALNQIQDKEYYRELQQEGYENIICYGIAFFKKNCRVQAKRID
ncbi:AAA family ATPase [uncultured Robinsoniella sp.]|uniref:AAA family ATPase n=1 Tax=uncultured Robinsoniella sp. TaxID=904190 RepID=UPI00374FCC96